MTSNYDGTDILPTSTHEKKKSILNSISLNTSRDRMCELFKDFKKLNDVVSEYTLSEPKPTIFKQSKNSAIGESTTTNGSLGNDSIDILKVNITKPSKLTAFYVGDLDKSVTEEQLYGHFKKFPSLSSVKICYAPGSKTSLGYGYVNFEDESAAKSAIDSLNYTILQGKEIRIMKSFQGKEKRFLGTNVFISNLNTEIISTLRSFYEKFKSFGEILSCKIDLRKRQGFISFAEKATAINFVETMNNKLVDGSQIFCSIHIPKALRDHCDNNKKKSSSKYNSANSGLSSTDNTKYFTSASTLNTGTHTFNDSKGQQTGYSSLDTVPSDISDNLSLNSGQSFKKVYVKGLPLEVSETDILKLFSSCGKIVEIFKESILKYKSSWGFVTFDSTESAITAVETFHKFIYQNRRLTCVKALKKTDREIQLKSYELERTSSSFNRSDEVKSLSEINHHIKTITPTTKSYKLYIHNLPEGLNENFFKFFLRVYTFEGKILKYSINLSHSDEPNYIEFQKETDVRSVHAMLNGVNIAGQTLTTFFSKRDLSGATTFAEGEVRQNVPTDTNCYSSSKVEPTLIRTNSDYFPHVQLRHPSVHFQPNSVFRYTNHQQPQHYYHNNNDGLHLPPTSSTRYDFKIGSDSSALSRHPSVIRISDKRPNRESIIERLEQTSLQFIDFLTFPAATRPSNLKRVLQYLVDSYWQNNLDEVDYTLTNIEDETIKSEFKTQLIQTIKLFGFDR